MRSEQFKSVNDRKLAELYLSMTEEDKSYVKNEIVNRFIADKAKPRTAKAAVKRMIPIIIGAYLGSILGILLSKYNGNIGDLLLDSISCLIGVLIAAAIMVIYTVIKNN